MDVPQRTGEDSGEEARAEKGSHRMKIFNASGRPVYLYRGLNKNPSLSIYETIMPMIDRQLVDTGLQVGFDVLDETMEVPLCLVQYKAVMGMPAQRDGVGYIVNYETAHAADAVGRTDCYLPVDLVGVNIHTGRGIGFQKLGRLG